MIPIPKSYNSDVHPYLLDAEVASSLRKILLDENLMKGIDRASMEATSELEGFHAALNRNAPKMEGFSYSGMLSRYAPTLFWFACLQMGIQIIAIGEK